MKKCFLLLLFMMGTVRCLSQQFVAQLNIDSLKKVIRIAKDTQQLNAFNLLSRRYLFGEQTQSNFDSAQSCAQQALAVSRQLNYKKGIGNALLNEGIVTIDKVQNSHQALLFLQEALPLLKQTQDDFSVATCYGFMGDCFHFIGQNQVAITYYDSAATLFQKLRDTVTSVWQMTSKSDSYFDLGNYPDAYKSAQMALDLTAKNDTLLQTYILSDIAKLYLSAGFPQQTIAYVRKIRNFYPGPRAQYQKYLPWTLKRGLFMGGEAFLQLNQVDSASKVAVFLNIPIKDLSKDGYLFYGHLNFAKQQYHEALLYFKNGYDLAVRSKREISVARHANELGRTYFALKDFTKALFFTQQALRIASQIHALLEARNAAGILTDIYDAAKQYTKAYHYTTLYKSLNDSVVSEEFKRKLALVQIQNELEIQKQRAQLLAKENQVEKQRLKGERMIRNGLITGTLVFLLFGLIIYRNIALKKRNEAHRRELVENELQLQKIKSQQQLSDLEMQALRAQMNPHFIFNCLNSINRFILRNDSEAASDYLTKFSRLIRMVLNYSKEAFISLSDELEMLRLYLEMERLRFKNAFDYDIRLQNDLDTEAVLIPPLLLQPFAENAIWHGLLNKEGRGRLTLLLSEASGILTCMIEDDGVGRAKAAAFNSKSVERIKSMGLQITKERLALLNKDSNERAFLEVEDLYDSTGLALGTRVILKIRLSKIEEAYSFSS